MSLAVGLRAPAFSLSVGRGEEIELFMWLSGLGAQIRTKGPMEYRTIVLRFRDARTSSSALSPRDDRNPSRRFEVSG